MRVKKIHLIAACGTGMGTLACMLQDQGYAVAGSDQQVYPPMSDFLAKKRVRLYNGFSPENLDWEPDLVIIGNSVTRDNPEAQEVMTRGLPYLSMPQALIRFFAGQKKVVLVTGTHGKTTTASVIAAVLYEAGLDPSFMIGGIVNNFESGFRIGKGAYFVVEGDEYDTAFFDKRPKFMHYRPAITVLTGVEFDHADIFTDFAHVKAVFREFAEKLPPESLLIGRDRDETLNGILARAACKVVRFGEESREWSFTNYTAGRGKTVFDINAFSKKIARIETAALGKHNALNILSALCAAHAAGVQGPVFETALEKFRGVKRRQEIRGVKNGISVMDDFAHHPSAVQETIAAVKPFFETGRVIAVFEPRTNTSMRNVFQDIYPAAFTEADLVCIRAPSRIDKIPPEERVSCEKLVHDIAAGGTKAFYFQDTEAVIDFLKAAAKEGDLVLVMSNGGFDNIHTRLLDVL